MNQTRQFHQLIPRYEYFKKNIDLSGQQTSFEKQQESNYNAPLMITDERRTKGTIKSEFGLITSQNKDKTEKKFSKPEKNPEKPENKVDKSPDRKFTKLINKATESEVSKRLSANTQKELKKSDSQKLLLNDRKKDSSEDHNMESKTEKGKLKALNDVKNSQSFKSFHSPFSFGNFILSNNRKRSNNLQERTETLSSSQTKEKNTDLLVRRNIYIQKTKTEYKIANNSVRNLEENCGSLSFLKVGTKQLKQSSNKISEGQTQTLKYLAMNQNIEETQQINYADKNSQI